MTTVDFLLPTPGWPAVLLAVALLADIIMSIRPMKFIQDCLDGVGFPRDWWWALLAIKSLAVVGLIAGLWIPGVAISATIGVTTYFCCAAYAHIRAKFFGQAFWLNCLGMLALSAVVLLLVL